MKEQFLTHHCASDIENKNIADTFWKRLLSVSSALYYAGKLIQGVKSIIPWFM